MEMRFGHILVLTLALALAGCADDDGDNGDPDPTGTGGPTGTATGTATGTGTTGPAPTPSAQPVYVNGTVSGVADCALIGIDAPPAQGSMQPVPAGMGNGSYALSIEATGTETACIVFDDGTTGNSGTVGATATEFTVYVDGAPAGVPYSVLFTPAA